MANGGAFAERSPATLTVADVMSAFARTSAEEHTVPADGTLRDAIAAIVQRRVPIIIAEREGSFVGVLTARDILRALHEFKGSGDPLSQPVTAVATPAAKVVTAAPEDTLSQVSVMMSEARVRSLPVVAEEDGGLVELAGVITLKDVSDYVNAPDTGAKESFSRNILGRRGLGSGATMRSKEKDAAKRRTPGEAFDPAVTPLPAPASGAWVQLRTGAACEARQVKPPQPRPRIEDAHFVARVSWPADREVGDTAARAGGHRGGSALGGGAVAPLTYAGVIDGVGSWAGAGVDPTAFSGALRDSALEAVVHSTMGRVSTSSSAAGSLGPPSPLTVLQSAWEEVTSRGVVGSATALVMSLDPLRGHLAVANVGDCGVIIVRPGLEATAGTLVSGAVAPGPDGGDLPSLAVAFRSSQQLHDFNFPFQLGFAPDEEAEDAPRQRDLFETPAHADFMRVPVLPGDIVIAASDGLFDNVDSDGILRVVAEWVEEGNVDAAQARPAVARGAEPTDPESSPGGDSDVMRSLAQRLVDEAVSRSMDKTRDSPFAILAKDNDIMWSGGIPDDVTVVVGLVTEGEWPPSDRA